MKSTDVMIAGKTYTISELPRRKNSEWRGMLKDKIGPLADLLEAAPRAMDNGQSIQASQLVGVVRQALLTSVDSIDMVYDLIYAYSPELKKDRKHIDDNSYDSEIMKVLNVILGMAFPFGEMVGKLMTLNSGQ